MSSVRNPTPVNGWIELKPFVMRRAHVKRCIRTLVRRVGKVRRNADAATLAAVRRRSVEAATRMRSDNVEDATFCLNVLCDLVLQGWRLKTRKGRLYAKPPSAIDSNPIEEKARVRRAHLVERDAQLAQPSVRAFVAAMERRRHWRGEWHSVFSLMRDGRDLASELYAAARLTGPERVAALAAAIDPYVQPAIAGKKCPFTGLDLLEVWRYFRHTWTTVYQSTPGRKLFFLIRDRAAPNHPVIGIGALGSPIIQLAVRDTWVGWTGDQVVDAIIKTPTKKWAVWIIDSLNALLRGIETRDLISEHHLTRRAMRRPTHETIARLRSLAATERRLHQLYPAARQHKDVGRESSSSDWRLESRTHLFRSKRASGLADLLEARRALEVMGFERPDSKKLREAASSGQGRKAIVTIARYIKAAHAGIDMMDVTVCGAVAPYNRVLGGKLVSLLMASPAIAKEYRRRYKSTPSLIASAMAGRRICRSPRLVLLGTTSLYSVGASQYHRLRFKTEATAARQACELAYIELGRTAGYGSYHFSQETMASLEPVLSRLERGRQVNSIFGEGVNPKLRKVRSALDAVGLPSDLLMQHSSPRIVYAIPLARNFRDVLLGLAERPVYILRQTNDSSQQLAAYWRERWLAKRIEAPDVISDLARHRLTYPIEHGARVRCFEADGDSALATAVAAVPQQATQLSTAEIATFRRLHAKADRPVHGGLPRLSDSRHAELQVSATR
jgi:hypothetical protein